ncbi:putative sulfate transporter [Microlunatus phosphovorus NM-1]|uniref:Putative sulfate transporter n=1 Tax=Microlunatus phosphovorus (strain ATCC 700054 / DSM 10555 / JCM 9379 / NBRC 101784 / NCIMB 13414 / VKM Ac-1990 / NM-1) TaxID=1032480 RepID=F5XRP7_MICPN|nr:SulP family inorganic anion transporter [Microlunatus phosphovorus]BAK37110.1 putative sulfate transporter [Microlunatus phosphovorus NM-1]
MADEQQTWRRLIPSGLRGYQRSWLRADVLAGLTLAAVAIPETMGYASIAQMPVVTGLYTVLFPTILFALLGSSRLLVVGADSATAAILASGLAGLGVSTLVPGSPHWVALGSLIALVSGGLLVLARLLRLGFLGDFLSASVLIGFLTGVGIQVGVGQLPEMLGISKGSGSWLEQQAHLLSHLGETDLLSLAFAVGTIVLVLGGKRLAPKVPGAILAVVISIIVSSTLHLSARGVAVVGPIPGGFPPLGLPSGIGWSDVTRVLPTAITCFVLIIAQSAATSRSFASRHGERVDVNRDIVGLSAANLAAGLSGTFVVNGSPTKTQILDEQQARTQVANLTMAGVVLVILLFFTGVLAELPRPVLGAIVFLIAVDLIDLRGLERVRLVRGSEFVIAVVTAVVVLVAGVQHGIVLAVALSLLNLVRRQYRPHRFVISLDADGEPSYRPAEPGMQSSPGLVVFRYDADLFYANANQFADSVRQIITSAPDPVRWLVLDCSSITDADYSAGAALHELVTFVHNRGAVFALAGVDPELRKMLARLGILRLLHIDHVYDTVEAAVAGYRASGPDHEK